MFAKVSSFISLLVMVVSSAGAQSIPVKVSAGKVDRIEQFPSQFVTPRTVDIWLPEGYSKNNKYAVLYMQDGQMLFDSTTTWNKQEWQLDEIMTRLQKGMFIKDCIVVGIWNNGEQRRREYFPQKATEYIDAAVIDSVNKAEWQGKGPNADNYLQFIVRELKPYIDRTYPTLSDRANTVIGGSSFGGLLSMYAICEYPAVFGGAMCISTHWPGSLAIKNDAIPEGIIKYFRKHLPNPKYHNIYFDYGTETLDKAYKPFQKEMDHFMRKKGYNRSSWMTKEFKGADHTEKSWAARLDIPLQFLLERMNN